MNIERLEKQLIFDEGQSLKLYKCTAHKLTIGIGRNIEDRGIRQDESTLMFNNDVKEVIETLKPALNHKYRFDFDSLSDVRQEVLLNMAFQLGVPRLLKFKNTFRHLKGSNFNDTSLEMLNSLWAKQTPKRAKRLAYAMKHNKFKKGGLI